MAAQPQSFHDSEVYEAVEDDYDDDLSFRRTAAGTMGALPWWVVSVVVHAILLFLTTLIIVHSMRKDDELDVLAADLAPPEKEKEKEPEKDVRVKQQTEVNIKAEAEKAFYTPEKIEVSETDEVETENEIVSSEHPSRGQQDAVSTSPAEGTGTVGFFGVGGGGRAGAFGWRTGGGRRKRALNPGGGRSGATPESEATVNLGLEWLKHHQEPEGRWDRKKYGGTPKEKFGPHDVGVTGLATLAFLGAGHTERHGKYKQTVKKAVAWILKEQRADGLWPPFTGGGGSG